MGEGREEGRGIFFGPVKNAKPSASTNECQRFETPLPSALGDEERHDRVPGGFQGSTGAIASAGASLP